MGGGGGIKERAASLNQLLRNWDRETRRQEDKKRRGIQEDKKRRGIQEDKKTRRRYSGRGLILSGRNRRLTRREMEVGHLLARGLEQRQIAERLVISRRTAYAHVRSIRRKLGGCSRFEAAVRLRCEMGYGE